MRDKLTTLEQAAAGVKTGAQVVMSANMNRSPMALLRQVVRQGTRDLRVVGVVGGEINIDFLVGAGAVRVVDTCSVTLGRVRAHRPQLRPLRASGPGEGARQHVRGALFTGPGWVYGSALHARHRAGGDGPAEASRRHGRGGGSVRRQDAFRGGEGAAARTWRCSTRRKRTGRATCRAATTSRR